MFSEELIGMSVVFRQLS